MRDLPDRHQTLRTTIDWRYQLLAERMLFDYRAVVVGGWTLEATQAVCRPDAQRSRAVVSLSDKQLVFQQHTPQTEPSFAMLETICEDALAHLVAPAFQATIQWYRQQHQPPQVTSHAA